MPSLAWMGFGIPRRSSNWVMESPMPPWMQRIAPKHPRSSKHKKGADRRIHTLFFATGLGLLSPCGPSTSAAMGRNSKTSLTP